MVKSALPNVGQVQANDRVLSPSSQARAMRQWRCLNCGQLVFTAADDAPPDLCQGCKDMTTWRALAE